MAMGGAPTPVSVPIIPAVKPAAASDLFVIATRSPIRFRMTANNTMQATTIGSAGEPTTRLAMDAATIAPARRPEKPAGRSFKTIASRVPRIDPSPATNPNSRTVPGIQFGAVRAMIGATIMPKPAPESLCKVVPSTTAPAHASHGPREGSKSKPNIERKYG